jgi:chorismate synthase
MKFLTAGESHGEALAGIIDGYPSGVDVDIDFINSELARRQMGFGRGQRMSIEKDEIKILSGIRKGKTIGSPISFLIYNLDWKNQKERLDSEEAILNPRPGHADLPGFLKYRQETIRNVLERSSARETAVRVAVGSFAKLILKKFSVFIVSYVEQIGNIKIDQDIYSQQVKRDFNPEKNKNDLDFVSRIENSLLRCPDQIASGKISKLIRKTAEEGDSLGGAFRIIVSGLPPGLGSYVNWEKRLDAKLAAAVMSVPSIKCVGFGKGQYSSEIKGTQYHDEIYFDENTGFHRHTNNAGGIEGGMTNGEPVDIRVAAKPIPTTMKGLRTVNIDDKKEAISFKERADTCAVPSAAIVSESMVAIELFNSFQDKFGKDNLDEMTENYANYMNYLKNI